jgi:hypothetical protein
MSAWRPFSFLPEFAGEVTFDEVPADVFRRIERRVGEGFLVAGIRSRANYRVVESRQGTLEIEAADKLTAWNVGLNRVVLRRAGGHAIAYRVTFWRWTGYCLALAGAVGGMLALMYFIPAVRREVASYRHGVWLYFGMGGFWALVWPWCLTAVHRLFARRLLERILREIVETRPGKRRAA